MNIKKRVSELSLGAKTIIYVLLIIISICMLYPLLLVVNISLKSTAEYYADPIGIVKNVIFDNYFIVWDNLDVLRKFAVTVVLASAATFVTVVSAALAAYPISRLHFKSAGKVYVFILASMFFPSSLIANITMMKDILHVYGSPIALILIWSIGGLQLYTFMFVGFIKQIPRELEEAAVVDGAKYLKVMLSVIVPLMKPIMATVIMLKIIGCWNDFLNPYIYISDPSLRTLSTGLYTYMGQFASKWNYLSTAIIMVALPMIILYLFLQRYIISGIASGAVKG